MTLRDIPTIDRFIRAGIAAESAGAEKLYTVKPGFFNVSIYSNLAFDQGERLMSPLPIYMAYARIELEKLKLQLEDERDGLQTRLQTENEDALEQFSLHLREAAAQSAKTGEIRHDLTIVPKTDLSPVESLDFLRQEVAVNIEFMDGMIRNHIRFQHWARVRGRHIAVRIHEGRMVLALVESKSATYNLNITGAPHPQHVGCLGSPPFDSVEFSEAPHQSHPDYDDLYPGL